MFNYRLAIEETLFAQHSSLIKPDDAKWIAETLATMLWPHINGLETERDALRAELAELRSQYEDVTVKNEELCEAHTDQVLTIDALTRELAELRAQGVE